jgi:hypothetical protein
MTEEGCNGGLLHDVTNNSLKISQIPCNLTDRKNGKLLSAPDMD